MLMEAFTEAGPKFDFAITGHSGDGPRIALVEVCHEATLNLREREREREKERKKERKRECD